MISQVPEVVATDCEALGSKDLNPDKTRPQTNSCYFEVIYK